MTIYNVPGKIYLNLGELDKTEFMFDKDLDVEAITWSVNPETEDSLMYVQQQLYTDQHNEAKMFHNAYKAAHERVTEYRFIIKQAIKHKDPAVFLASELLRLEAEQ